MPVLILPGTPDLYTWWIIFLFYMLFFKKFVIFFVPKYNRTKFFIS